MNSQEDGGVDGVKRAGLEKEGKGRGGQAGAQHRGEGGVSHGKGREGLANYSNPSLGGGGQTHAAWE
jgi:hypothetical protein